MAGTAAPDFPRPDHPWPCLPGPPTSNMKGRMQKLHRWLRFLKLATMNLLLSAAIGTAAEVRIDLGDGLTGAWTTPASDWNGRTMVLFHGFADDMDGAGDLMKRLAAELGTHGVASLRINFRGEGDRHRTNITSTFHSRVEDGSKALGFVRAQPGVAVGRIGLMGWSLGGATAIEVASRETNQPRCLVLWSSSSGDLHQALTTGSFAPVAAEAAARGIGSMPIPGWKTVTLRREFFDSYRGFHTDVALARFRGAFLSVRGTEDYLPAHETEFLRVVKGHPRDALLIGGADHIFNVFQPDLGHADRAVAQTADWIRRVL